LQRTGVATVQWLVGLFCATFLLRLTRRRWVRWLCANVGGGPQCLARLGEFLGR
jgi:hypothetical protein